MEAMQLQTRTADIPRIRRALKIYKVASIITGTMLLLLLAEMILKYSPTHVELFAGGGQLLHFAPVVVGEGCQRYTPITPAQGVGELAPHGNGGDLSLLILIVHGCPSVC